MTELVKKEKPKECEVHDFEIVKERVQPRRTNDKQPQFTQSGAYFTYKKCKNCPKKMLLDYKVEA